MLVGPQFSALVSVSRVLVGCASGLAINPFSRRASARGFLPGLACLPCRRCWHLFLSLFSLPGGLGRVARVVRRRRRYPAVYSFWIVVRPDSCLEERYDDSGRCF